jgi:predicted ATPase/DNA-binding winged helix-turn-helix (wHTH) protein
MPAAYRFGNFEVQPDQRKLLADGRPLALGQRAFDVLLALIERRDRLVGKHELLDAVWPGLVVEENNLQVHISALRKLLGPQAIATVPGRGYRFTAALDDAPAQRGAESPARDAPVEAPGLAAANNLPKDLPQLFGRDTDLAALRTLVDGHRLVTVVGAGGIGKSRIAQAAAHAALGRWPDGAWMVELAGLSDPALVPNAIARALDVTIAGGDADAARAALVAALAARTLLLAIDNCEHLLDAVSAVVEAILRDAPGVTVLATSQEPLRLPDEHQFRLAPLAVPADAAATAAREAGAVALFEARVRAVDPRFALTDENLALAIDVCRRLDGLPLAVELAAARVGTLGLRAVRDRLDARFKLLTGGARATLRRHQTLRAALEWSHHLLNADEQAVFRRLGAFAGGFTMEAAQGVAADDAIDEWALLDHLSALVEKSLVVMDADDPPRYRLLESARAFALEQLADAGETAATLQRHALAMRDFLRRVDDANLDGELRTDQYAARVLPELDNLRAAFAWATGDPGDPPAAAALAAHAGALIDYAVECQEWLLALEPQVRRGDFEPAVAARFWRALAAGNMVRRVPIDRQVEAARRARDLYRELGQPRREFSSLIRLATFFGIQDDHAHAEAALAEARALMRPDWPPEFRILMLRRESSTARSTSRIPEALALYRELIAASAATGDWRLEVMARGNLVDFVWETGPLEDAVREACTLLDLVRARPAPPSDMDTVHANAIGTLSEAGRIDEATAVAVEGLPVMRQSRGLFFEEWIYLFWRRGMPDVAARLLGAFDVEQARIGTPLQPNERRLLAQARAGLESQMAPEAFASHHAAGAALGIDACFDLIARSLPHARRSD